MALMMICVAVDALGNEFTYDGTSWTGVSAITPYNAALIMAFQKLIPALMAGNSVILRPSPLTPISSLVLGAAADADAACLADAICDPGPAKTYSPAGHGRIVALGRELTALRAHLSHPLPDLVAEEPRIEHLPGATAIGMTAIGRDGLSSSRRSRAF